MKTAKNPSKPARFNEKLEFGKIGEEIVMSVWTSKNVDFTDVRNDPAYQKIDVDFVLNNPLVCRVLVDVKTHSGRDCIPVETLSNVEREKPGCDFETHADWFVHVYPATGTIVSVNQKPFTEYVTKTRLWNDLPEHTIESVDGDGGTWHSRYKLWPLDKLPNDGMGVWWKTVLFTPSRETVLRLAGIPGFTREMIKQERTNPPKFKAGDVIRCPFCLQKNRPGNMVYDPSNGGFFACKKNCLPEHRKDPSVRSSFNPDGRDRAGNYVAVLPLGLLKLLAD